MSKPIDEGALARYMAKERDALLADPYDTLTNREREVLQMVAEGLSSTEIAERLVISSRTVETHRANLMRKLNLKNQAEVIHYAIRRGILPMDDTV